MPKVGGRRKKAKSHKELNTEEERQIPKAFVFKKGLCSNECKELTKDFRKCFYPNTAMNLEDSNKLAIKSYLKAAKYYSVTHLIAFQQSKQKTYMRLIKVGGGQITFRVMNYCRMKEIMKHGGQPFNLSFKEPLIVLNNFTQNNQVRQVGRSIQQLFPSINLDKINLANVKRVMSFTYQNNKKCIYFRHYKLMIEEGGLQNSFKELLMKDHQDISKFKSFAEFMHKKIQTDEQPQIKQNQQGIKLVEMGPRIKLKFLSFKEGFGRIQLQNEEPSENMKKEIFNQNYEKEQQE